jgi:hypothetical protein
MALDVDYASLLAGAVLVTEAAKWAESAVETHTRAMAQMEEHLAGSVTAGVVVDLSRQLTDVGADLMPALQGLAQGMEVFAKACAETDQAAGRAAGR